MEFNLNYIYIAISWILLRWHDLWSVTFASSPGVAWVLSIVFLVITVRAILFPIFVKQIKSQRRMQELQPYVKEIRDKHEGDQQAIQKETMELFRREGVNPLMGCLPIFLQIPVFLGLFHVLRLIDPTKPRYLRSFTTQYGWEAAEFKSAAAAKIFGAPIAAAFRDNADRLQALEAASGTAVRVVAAVLILTMVVTTYITQRQIFARTKASGAVTQQQEMIQKLMLYGIPASLLISGALFPIGVVIYWVTTNLFSMGQQFWVIKKMPPPAIAGGKPSTEEERAEAAKRARDLAPKPGQRPTRKRRAPSTGQRVSVSKDGGPQDSDTSTARSTAKASGKNAAKGSAKSLSKEGPQDAVSAESGSSSNGKASGKPTRKPTGKAAGGSGNSGNRGATRRRTPPKGSKSRRSSR